MVTYVFPGQGSQVKGMGSALFEEFPDVVEKADSILGYSLKTLCLEDPSNQLNKTEFTQPALYVVNSLSYLKKIAEGKKPDYVMGHSLGEYNALLAAGIFDFETGLKLVKKRGELMSQVIGGGMAAIIGLKENDVHRILQEENLNRISVANYNSYTQIVISGPSDDIHNAELIFTKAGASLFIPLKVSGAFHSPYMHSAQQIFDQFLQEFTFSLPIIPVIANVTSAPYEAANIHFLLSNQITNSVKWTQSIDYLIKQGETTFEEVGVGKVLRGLIRRIQQGQ